MFAQIQDISEITQLAATRERIIKGIAACEADLPKFSVVDISAPANFNVGHNLYMNKYKNGMDLSIDLSACYIASEAINAVIGVMRSKKSSIESRLLVLGIQSIPDVIPLVAKPLYERDSKMPMFVIPVSGGNGGLFVFVSSNPSVVTVDEVTGVARPVAVGSAIITVTEANTDNTTNINVIVYQEFRVTPSVYFFLDTDMSEFKYFFYGSGNYAFTSSEQTVATVNSTTGVLSQVAEGMTSIQVTDIKTERSLTTEVHIVPHMQLFLVSGILVDESVTASTSGGSNQTRYSSSDVNVATVDQITGVVLGISAGTATITALDLNTSESVVSSITVS